MNKTTRQRLSTALIVVPLLVLGAAAYYTSGGSDKPEAHKAQTGSHKYKTYAEAGADLQKGYQSAMTQNGYEYQVVACAHSGGYKYACSALLSKDGQEFCLVVKFTDNAAGDLNVSDASEAKDPKACQ